MSLNEEDALNPFVALGEQNQAAGVSGEESNPFVPIGELPDTGRTGTPLVETAGRRFVQGAGRGFLRPVHAFTHLADKENQGFAGAAGEFAGMLGAGVALYGGAGAVLRGVGLLKTMAPMGVEALYFAPLGRSTASLVAAQGARGAVAGAAFEAFAGDSPDEFLERGAKGALLGAAGDVLFANAAQAWRAGRSSWKPTGTFAPVVAVADSSINVHPLALKLENAMRPSPNDTEEMIKTKLRLVGDPKKQLHEAFLTMMRTHMPGGQAVLPGLTQKEITQLYKTGSEIGQIQFAAFRRMKGEDLYDVLVVDKDRSLLTPNMLKGKASIEEVVKAVNAQFPELTVQFPKNIPPGYAGLYTPRNPWTGEGPRVEVATSTAKFKAFAGITTLLHEVTHHIEYVVGARRGSGGGRPTMEQMFLLGPKTKLVDTTLQKLRLDEITREMKAVTQEVLTHTYRNVHIESESVARESARKFYEQDPSYFDEPIELISRMAELLFLDPSLAKAIAPRSSQLVGRLIQREAPEIRQLMSREAQLMLDMFNDLWRFQEGGIKTVFNRGAPQVTGEMLVEFGKTGWAKGLRAVMDGKQVEFVGRMDGGRAVIKSLDTGLEDIVDMSALSRPLLQSVAQRGEELLRAIDNMVDKVPRSMPVNIQDFVKGEKGALTSAVRRGLVDLNGYVTITGSIREWVKSLPEQMQEKLIQQFGSLDINELDIIKGLDDIGSKQEEQLRAVIESVGYKGIIQNDNGLMKVFVADKNTLQLSEVIEAKKFGAEISGRTVLRGLEQVPLHDSILTISPSEWLKHSLRIEGVPEADMEYFYEIALNRLGEKLKQVVDPAALAAQDNTIKELKKFKPLFEVVPGGDDIPPLTGGDKVAALQIESGLKNDEMVARNNVELYQLPDGRTEIRDRSTKSILGVVRSREEAWEYVREMGVDTSSPSLVPDFPGAVSHGGGGAPPKPNSPLIPSPSPINPKTGKLVGIETFFGSWTTALENFAKRLENKGFGAAYTRVYKPAHEAMLKVQNELSVVKRDALGGLTFGDKLGEISQALVKVNRNRYPLISGHIEALTKEEISQAGGLMARAMTPGELDIAREIERVGLANDIPRLMSADRLIDSAVNGKLESVIEKMKAMKLSAEAEMLLAQFESMPVFKSRDEVMGYLGLSDEEKAVIKIIRDSSAMNKDEFSIYAVSRYASAPRLKAGFKNGRDQFAAENKMTDRELLVSRFANEALEAGFLDSGLDAKRHVSGYFPHLQKWVSEGFHPSAEFLPPDVLQWVAQRYRTGELNVFETDPLSVVYRHLRALYMKRHFDPIMPEVNANLRAISRLDERGGEVMQEYVLELMGKPHETFGRLQGALNHMMKTVLGKEAPPRLANDIVSALSALTSAAVIPFRPALILRNFMESALKIAPRVGIKSYMQGLQYVTAQSTKKEAFLAALKGGAIRPGTQKLRSYHAAEELFGPAAPHAVQKYLHIFDKGFEWYQSADDWGRAIAFHSQRFRVMEHLDDFRRGRISLEELKSRSKINTFDPLDIQIAEGKILAGDDEGATSHLGQVLSREAMTRYGYADHPAGWNSVQGRIFGQFGTWPVQYKDYLAQGMTRGSMKDRAEFIMTHGALSGALVGAGAAVGLNLSSWTGSVSYTGGPFLDIAIDVTKSIGGSDMEKALARRNLYGQVPILGWMETGNPRSIFLPGSYLLGDLDAGRRALDDQGVLEGVMTGAGFRVMRPKDPRPLEWIFGS